MEGTDFTDLVSNISPFNMISAIIFDMYSLSTKESFVLSWLTLLLVMDVEFNQLYFVNQLK